MSKLQESTSAPVVVDPFEAVPSQMPVTATVIVNTGDPEDASTYRAIFYALLIVILIGGISGGTYHHVNNH
jgi:hypothetical protein